ncbi:Hypothetical protein HDN1F_20640 [gamma proteobacterium HdN1]|nr:Hypothetical protein HDN1F_20640 [gamma proteobacterium HdN1]
MGWLPVTSIDIACRLAKRIIRAAKQYAKAVVPASLLTIAFAYLFSASSSSLAATLSVNLNNTLTAPATATPRTSTAPMLQTLDSPKLEHSAENVPVEILYKNIEEYHLDRVAGVLEDKSGTLTIDDILQPRVQSQFIFNSQKTDAHNFGITKSAFWISITLEYPSWANTAQERDWYLEVARAQLQECDLYIPNGEGTYRHLTSDLRTPYSQRPVHHANSIFPISTHLDDKITLYLRIKSDSALILPINLWTPKRFIEKVADEEIIYGTFFGGMLILMLYNLFVYFSVRDASYLYFVLYLAGITLIEYIEIGHGLTLFEDNRSWTKHSYLSVLIWSTWWILIQFTRNFLETARYHRRVDHFLKFWQSFILMYLATSFIVDEDVVSRWVSGFTFFSVLLLLSVSFYCWSKENENAVYFSIGWLLTTIGGALQTLALLKVLPSAPIYLAATPIGILSGAVMISFALADRIKRMQKEALEANERAVQNMARYRSTFNNAIEGMYRMSIDGRIVSANPAMAHLLGYDSVDALIAAGKEAVTRCFPGGDGQLQQLAFAGKLQLETCYTGKNGKSIWVDHFSQMIRGANGLPSHIEGSLTDITERKERERAEQDREIDKLEKELATASATAKGDFLANMSHELRTPLTAIIGYSESLNDQSLSATDEQQAVDTIIRSSHHLLNIINDILDFSKVEASIVEVENVPLNPYLLLKDVYSYFTQKARSQNLAFEVVYHFPLPNRIHADPTRLKQILLNLCSNALKFTKEGSVTIDVGWDEERKLTRFSVIDTGAGLSEEQIGKLFQSYAQAEASTARQFGGTGLGLVISKQLAEKMGGTIEVTSEPGKGSCFTVYIGGNVPNRREWIENQEEATRATESVASQQQIQIPNLQGHILYADDSQDSQRLVGLILRDCGVQLTTVNNGDEVVKALQKQTFDLILMDIKMPIMTGIEATKILRKQGFTLPIIALTANVIKGDTLAYEQAGFTAALGKPIERAIFFQTLEKYLGK